MKVWKHPFLVVTLLSMAVGSGQATGNDTPQVNEGTAIVFVRAPDEFWIGADSLTTELKTNTASYICKINRERQIFFAFAGTPQFGEVYDAVSLASRVIDKRGSVFVSADDFARLILPSLNRALPQLVRYYPEYVKRLQSQNGPMLDSIFFGFENGQVVFSRLTFGISADSKSVILKPASRCPGDACPNSMDPVISILGVTQRFTDQMNAQPFQHSDPFTDIRHFLEQARKAEPGLVGGNMNLMQLDSTGVKWEPDARECKDAER